MVRAFAGGNVRAAQRLHAQYYPLFKDLFLETNPVPVKAARPFNNYGPGLKITDGRVLPDFAKNILADRDIVLLSDGSPRLVRSIRLKSCVWCAWIDNSIFLPHTFGRDSHSAAPAFRRTSKRFSMSRKRLT
jgi:hypothetical protein